MIWRRGMDLRELYIRPPISQRRVLVNKRINSFRVVHHHNPSVLDQPSPPSQRTERVNERQRAIQTLSPAQH